MVRLDDIRGPAVVDTQGDDHRRWLWTLINQLVTHSNLHAFPFDAWTCSDRIAARCVPSGEPERETDQFDDKSGSAASRTPASCSAQRCTLESLASRSCRISSPTCGMPRCSPCTT